MECTECGEPIEEKEELEIPKTVYKHEMAGVDPTKSKVTKAEQFAQQMKQEVEAKNGTDELLPIIRAVEDREYCVGTGFGLDDNPDRVYFYIHEEQAVDGNSDL